MADALNEVEDDETMTESQEYGGDESTKLSDTDKKKLIEALKHHPCLWDSTVPQDKQKETRFIERTGRKLLNCRLKN